MNTNQGEYKKEIAFLNQRTKIFFSERKETAKVHTFFKNIFTKKRKINLYMKLQIINQ